MPPDADIRLNRRAVRRYGIVTLEDVRACGLNERTFYRRVRAGHYVVLHSGVWRSVAVPSDPRGAVLGAVRAVGDDAVASHTTAAALWGLGDLRLTYPHHVTVPRRSRVDLGDAAVVHVSGSLRDGDVTSLGPVPLTDLPWTLLGCAGLVDRWTLEDLAIEAFRIRRSLRREEVLEVTDLVPNAPGRGDLRRAVARLDPEAAAALLSRMESKGLVLVRDLGLPTPAVNRRLHGPDGALIAKLDFDWEPPGITIEWDGLRYHSTPSQKRYDDARQNAIVLSGRIVLRYGWFDLVHEPERIREEVQRAFALRGAPLR